MAEPWLARHSLARRGGPLATSVRFLGHNIGRPNPKPRTLKTAGMRYPQTFFRIKTRPPALTTAIDCVRRQQAARWQN
jgi:hypothetical protein